MEMLIIGVVAIVAFAAVLVPLFRKGPAATAGEDEFASDGPARRGARALPQTRGDDVAGFPEADPATGAGVVPPIAAGPATPVAPSGQVLEDAPPATSDELELEIQRYRAALRAGTICRKCGQANPADSSFCFECGAPLPLAEAREFD